MPSYFDLNNRVALVTGASRGLGFAMAEALAEVGATVILNGRNADTLKVAADRMRDRRLKAEALAFDVTDRRASDAAIQSIARRSLIGRRKLGMRSSLPTSRLAFF